MHRKKKKQEILDECTLEGQYTIDEIEDVIDDIRWGKKEIPWVSPENIIGINYEAEREKILNNLEDYFSDEDKKEIDLGFTVSKIVIGDYCRNNAYQDTINRVKEKLPHILKNAISVTKNLYTYSPAFAIFWGMTLVTKENVHHLLEIAKNAYKEADACERIFLAFLFFEFFDAVYCLDYFESSSESCIGIDFFNTEDKEFFKTVELLAGLVHHSEDKEYMKNCKDSK